MLFAGKDGAGNHIYPYWWCFLFGGIFRNGKNGGYGWTPGIWRRTRKYYKENWKKAGYSWAEFVGLKKKKYCFLEEKRQQNLEENQSAGPKMDSNNQ